ncbi:dTMP kinase [Deltaproteobacteria bacterium TL4]
MNTGLFITFEGIDGCGKTTQLLHASEWLKQQGYSVLTTREPGGTLIGKQIRSLLLNPDSRELCPQSELLLYLADRIQHLHEVILPAKQQGTMVLCDRYHDSTVAYQGFGRQLDLGGIESIVNQWIAPVSPDLTLYIKISKELAAERLRLRKVQDHSLAQESRIDAETVSFFQRVSEGFDRLMELNPDRFVKINGEQRIDEIHQEVLKILRKRLDL